MTKIKKILLTTCAFFIINIAVAIVLNYIGNIKLSIFDFGYPFILQIIIVSIIPAILTALMFGAIEKNDTKKWKVKMYLLIIFFYFSIITF